jgi:hypothetical protein
MDIWSRYYSCYVLDELVHTTRERNEEYESLQDTYMQDVDVFVDAMVMLSTNEPYVWEMTVSLVEEELLEDHNFIWQNQRDIHGIMRILKAYLPYPSLLKLELSNISCQTCDELRLRIENLNTLHRMLS